MENNAVAKPSKEHVSADEPAWVFILLQDSLREADDALVMSSLLGETGRAIVWTMCEKFNCDKLGVPGQTCRVFERYLANLVRIGFNGMDQQGVYSYVAPRLMLILGCCFQIAMKTASSTVLVSPEVIRTYLASCGTQCTIVEIMNMEREIFRGIGYHVPLYNSVEMAELLADHLKVERNALELIGLFVQLAELRRHEIEEEVHWIAGLLRMPYSIPRVRTVHLAAGCVAAAVKKACLQTSNNVARSLARMLRVTDTYIKVLRDVIVYRVDPSKPSAPKPKHRPNILRKDRFAADAGHSGPQPSTSKSTLF